MQKNPSDIIPDLGPSLAQFLQEEQQQFPDIHKALPPILRTIAAASKPINEVVRKLGLVGMMGGQGTYNFSGDAQQKLDMTAHDCFVHMLATIKEVCAVVSEEEETIITFPNNYGNYVIALDPLDGSSNIDANAAIGTIFSVYQRCSPQYTPVQQEDVLQTGEKQLAAGYILYGTSTIFVYTACHGVHGFTYEPAVGAFFLTHQGMQMPHDGVSYAINDGYFDIFPGYIQRYIRRCRRDGYTARYMGALVADFHRHLSQGGIYLYPPTHKNPEGRLRLMLECNALACVAEQAGGVASNGQQAILTIQPQAIHQRVPLYIGSKNMVQALLEKVV
ncbi:MAG: class 1 fructose-bisphosphatase [Amoebophilaceae bacterium]|nr:class 1 fructose-bisphosphatase [Amoebophilaceae bacterium]